MMAAILASSKTLNPDWVSEHSCTELINMKPGPFVLTITDKFIDNGN